MIKHSEYTTPDGLKRYDIMLDDDGMFMAIYRKQEVRRSTLVALRTFLAQTFKNKPKRRKVAIDVGSESGHNFTLIGVHKASRRQAVLAKDHAGKIVKLSTYETAYQPWTPELISQKARLVTAVQTAETALAMFTKGQQVPHPNPARTGRHITIGDLVQWEIDTPDRVAKRLLGEGQNDETDSY
jgi:hypothetical protein